MEAGSLKSKSGVDRATPSLKTLGEESYLTSNSWGFLQSLALLQEQMCHSSLGLSLYKAFSPVGLCPNFPLLTRTSVTGLGPSPIQ